MVEYNKNHDNVANVACFRQYQYDKERKRKRPFEPHEDEDKLERAQRPVKRTSILSLQQHHH